MRMLRILPAKLIASLLLAFLFAACGHVRVVEQSLQEKWLPFIENGKTTRDEVILKLGFPSGYFENGRILTYPLDLTEQEGFREKALKVNHKRTYLYHLTWSSKCYKVPVSKAEYNLILVFDDRGALSRHTLLQVRP